jgi:hypothetical protein
MSVVRPTKNDGNWCDISLSAETEPSQATPIDQMIWPERYTPATTDNYVSNEIIVAGLTRLDVHHAWQALGILPIWVVGASRAQRDRLTEAQPRKR